jgi:hypothetical protein
MLLYDSLKSSLKNPSQRATLFSRAVQIVDAGVCAELSRLAYLPHEVEHAMLGRLKADLIVGGFSLREIFMHAGVQAILVYHIHSNQNVLVFRGMQVDASDM